MKISRVKMLGAIAGLTALLAAGLPGCKSGAGDDWLAAYLVTSNTDYLAANAARVSLDQPAAPAPSRFGGPDDGFSTLESKPGLDTDVTNVEVFAQDDRRRAYIVGRTSATIYAFNPDEGMAVLDSFTVGAGGWVGENPQDLLVLGRHKAYVSRYGSDDILIVDPSDGSRLGNISFAGAATYADGLARPSDMVAAGGKVFVALQNLDAGFNYCTASIENGMIAVIDPATDTVETVVDLHTADPYRLYFSRDRGQVLIASPGHFAVDSAGCAVFDPDFDASRGGLELMDVKAPYPVSLLVAGDDPRVMGTIFDVVGAGPGTAYLLVSDGFKNYGLSDRLLEVNLNTGKVRGSFRYPAAPTGDDDLSGLAAYDGLIMVGDRANRNVTVFVTGSAEPLAAAGLSLPPMGLAVIKP